MNIDQITAQSPRDAQDEAWRQTKININWSISSLDADPKGQQKMSHAARQGSLDWIDDYRVGFEETQDPHPTIIAMFRFCCDHDPLRSYNLGREALGLSPI